MEDQNEVLEASEALARILGQEFEFYDSAESNDERNKAFNNFVKAYQLMEESARTNDESRREDERLLIEREKLIFEKERLEFDKDVEQNRKKDSSLRKILDIGEISISVVGLIASLAVTMKTLNVNLDSVMTDRDAVNSATKLFDHFRFGRRKK